MNWHTLSPETCLEEQESSRDGLDANEVERRQKRYGLNKLPEKKLDSVFVVFMRQFLDPLIYILLFAGAVSLAIQHWSDAIFIFAVLAFNATLGTIQEYKAQTSAQSLQEVIRIRTTVRRGGRRREVDASELVPGDIIEIQSGQAVPADGRLLEDRELRVDESLLTGESEQVEKDTEAELEAEAGIGDRDNMLHAGTTVTDGRATAVVCATGMRTEVGRIAESLKEESGDPPLVQRMRRLTRLVAVFILGAVTLLSVVQISGGTGITETFFLAVALAVSAIPAGLPVAVTVALSVASYRMARRNVIVRQLPAVEGLGSCTEICSDKTGTLTQNSLTGKRIAVTGDGSFSVTGEGVELEGDVLDTEDGDPPSEEEAGGVREAVLCGILANEASLERDGDEVEASGDTVDVAFLVLGEKMGLHAGELEEDRPRKGRIPYSSERKFAASIHQEDGGLRAYVKGAVEVLLEMCDSSEREGILEEAEALAKDGYRVIGVASGQVEDAEAAREGDPEVLRDLQFQGLVGLIDPVRPEVPEAVGRCRTAGVGVRMVTGDHPETAVSIGRRLKIAEEDESPMTGSDMVEILDRDPGDPEKRVRGTHVFARIEPAQKTRLVEHLQEKGEFVAVTGDGVNDAPALNAAHISVAMGKGGTDVARRTAQLILGDDNFASIVNGIEEGRIAYDNVRKVVWLLISTSVAELTLFALALAFGMPLPLFAAQLLWLNLVTNGIQDVALAFEGKEPGILKRPPRRPDERIFNPRMLEQVAVTGGWMGIFAFGAFYYMIEVMGMGIDPARNLLLLLMVLFENVHIFNCRSERRSAFRIPLNHNWLLIGTVALAQGVHIATMWIPGLRDVLGMQPVSFQAWVILLGLALSIIVVGELFKQLRPLDSRSGNQ
ncbi:MAG: HAD-IC family P-type ATPase [Oceanipulchritudo sp.]